MKLGKRKITLQDIVHIYGWANFRDVPVQIWISKTKDGGAVLEIELSEYVGPELRRELFHYMRKVFYETN